MKCAIMVSLPTCWNVLFGMSFHSLHRNAWCFLLQTWEAAQMKCAIMVSLPTLMTSLHQLITGRMLDRTPAAAAVSAHKQQQQRLQQLCQPDVSEPTQAYWDQVPLNLNCSPSWSTIIPGAQATLD